MSESVELGTVLKKLRQEAGMSRSTLADAAGIPVRTLEAWEQDRRDFRKTSLGNVYRIAKALNIEANVFMRLFIK